MCERFPDLVRKTFTPINKGVNGCAAAPSLVFLLSSKHATLSVGFGLPSFGSPSGHHLLLALPHLALSTVLLPTAGQQPEILTQLWGGTTTLIHHPPRAPPPPPLSPLRRESESETVRLRSPCSFSFVLLWVRPMVPRATASARPVVPSGLVNKRASTTSGRR
jgi:hypothetical protein